MWRKIGQIVAVILGWSAIFAYIFFAAHLTQKNRSKQRVKNVQISLPGDGVNSSFITQEQMQWKLKLSGLPIEEELIDRVDVAGISEYISRDGFVKDVDVYVSSAGNLYIDIEQHEPVLRLMSGGFNSFVTESADVFCRPTESAYYASVVTGSFIPHFDVKFEGNAKNYFSELIDVETEKLRKIRNDLVELKDERKRCDDEDKLADLDMREARLKRERKNSEDYKKKLQKRGGDFVNLINFVSKVGKDPFWSAEVVQFVADTTYMGEISLRLIPRSGNFEILFGTLDGSDDKLTKLYKFYDKGLPHVGWERYKVVDVRYDKQIICRN
jgi:hypothetical protein